MSTGATLAHIVLSGREAIGAAITPDGRRLLVGVRGDTTNGSAVDVIDTASGTVIGVQGDYGAPNSIAMAPDGATAYVASPFADTITAISPTGGATTQRRGIGARSLAVTPDQRTLLSADSHLVDILDLPALASRGYAPTDTSPAAVAVTPDQAPRAALHVGRQSGHRLSFDASASTSVSSPIARYTWDFGDGRSAVTTTPKVSHTYPRKGTYTASVTLTSRAGTSTTQVFTGQTMSRNGSSLARATVPVTVR